MSTTVRYAADGLGFAGLAGLAVDHQTVLDDAHGEPVDATGRFDGAAMEETAPRGEPDLRWRTEDFIAPDDWREPTRAAAAEDGARAGVPWRGAMVAAALLAAAIPLTAQLQKQRAAPETAASALVEQLPPVARGEVLNPAQIRYCLAQGIRLSAAAEAVGAYGEAGEALYRALYHDHEKRCAEYRYQAGAFEAAREAVESRRPALSAEGLALLAELDPGSTAGGGGQAPMAAGGGRLEMRFGEAGDDPAAVEQPMREVAGVADKLRLYDSRPRRLIKDIQWRLYKLNHYLGPIDGIDSAAVRDGVRRFVQSHPEFAPPRDDRQLFELLESVYPSALKWRRWRDRFSPCARDRLDARPDIAAQFQEWITSFPGETRPAACASNVVPPRIGSSPVARSVAIGPKATTIWPPRCWPAVFPPRRRRSNRRWPAVPPAH